MKYANCKSIIKLNEFRFNFSYIMFYKETYKLIQKLFHQVHQTLSKRQQMKVSHFYRNDQFLISIDVINSIKIDIF